MRHFPRTGLLALMLVGFSWSFSGPALAGPFEDGATAYRAGDFATALEHWRPLADRGNAAAQFALGNMYDSGMGVPQDYAQAFAWTRKAADRGFRDAQNKVGCGPDTGHRA